MTKRIKVTGYFDATDDEHDPDHETGLTAEAFDAVMDTPIGSLEDVNFEVVD